MTTTATGGKILHATCVQLRGQGLIIRGASGTGKSALALELMAFGATLVADDRVRIWRRQGQVMATAPEGLPHLIEARQFGLLNADLSPPVPVCALVDLDDVETERLPVQSQARLLGYVLPCFRRVSGAHFAPALMQYLKAGALDPDA